MDNLNPYQVPNSVGDPVPVDYGDTIAIDGSVSIDDIVALTPQNLLVNFLRSMTIGVACVILGLSIFVPMFGASQLDFSLSIVILAAIVCSAAVMVVSWYFARTSKAHRSLRKNPHLIGPLVGRLDGFGFTFYNEERSVNQQFSWAAFPIVYVSSAGIRLDREVIKNSFIAIPASSIDDYELSSVRAAIIRFREQADQPAILQVEPDWRNAPADAIRFEAFAAPKTQIRTLNKVLLRLCALTMGIGSIAFLIAILGYLFLGWNDDWMVIVGLPVVAASTIYYYFGDRAAPPAFAVRQWGWATKGEIFVCSPDATVRANWSATSVSRLENGDIVVLSSKCGVLVMEQNLLSGDWATWQKWSATAKSIASDGLGEESD